MKKIKDSDGPSSIAKPKKWMEIQTDRIYFNHRPAEASGNPVTLQHPIFGTFFEDYENIEPNNVDYAFVLDVVNSMSNVFDDENARKVEFKRLFREYYNISFNDYVGEKMITDGTSFSKGGMYMISNLEVKPELGVGGCCPYNQGNAYYAKYIANLPIQNIIKTRLPCFLLYLTGRLDLNF